MKIYHVWRTLAVLALAASLLALLQPVYGADPRGTRTAIKAQAKKYDEAYTDKDAAALASLYHEDAQILPADRGIVKGRKAIETFRREDIEGNLGKLVSTLNEFEDHGNLAIQMGSWLTRAINLVTINPYRFVPNASIAGQCQKADFYENHIRLNELIKKREDEYALLLRGVSDRRDFNSDEAHHLRLLMTDLHTRSKKTAEESKQLPKRLSCEGLRWAIKTGQIPPNPSGEVLEDVIDFSGAPGNTMKHAGYLFLELHTMECKLLLASGTSSFVTSDNPVVLLNQFCAHLPFAQEHRGAARRSEKSRLDCVSGKADGRFGAKSRHRGFHETVLEGA